ncbi:SMI1/KNR4 family protein [Nocardiopsis sp. RSe5-2]|uniref:SMI1/KNR4 family protein n=1 Tax=Nocardiopsis endophytica TaxID=3018445 RepID=A0ABT4U6J6_9ACTN|nr:SMI1/KNR4 family protein [Nocardiopsis endophytica]MDA2812568.1 SMI1/KNR4 family protein [Nocardiopsis endophytica]
MPERNSWPVVLGLTISAKRELRLRDPEDSDDETLPRVKLSPEELEALEREHGGPFPQDFRDFLLHADGWPGVYYDLDLFGSPELQGAGRWPVAEQLLAVYTGEGVMARIGLDPEGVIPVAAGDGNDLVLLIRPGRKDEGQVSWILGGEEYVRAEDYKAFVEFIMTLLRS